MKKCLVCNFPKEIKKEDNKKYKINMIHEYNYSCYECLDNMKKQRAKPQASPLEKELLDIYNKLKMTGIIDE
jgi:hypothetical protein